MAVTQLHPESVPATPDEFDRLYAAWKHAKANWDVQSYSPENYADGLPDEVDGELCGATADALNAFLLHPVDSLRQLAIKLRVFRDEDIIDNWCQGAAIVACLAADAHRLAFGRD